MQKFSPKIFETTNFIRFHRELRVGWTWAHRLSFESRNVSVVFPLRCKIFMAINMHPSNFPGLNSYSTEISLQNKFLNLIFGILYKTCYIWSVFALIVCTVEALRNVNWYSTCYYSLSYVFNLISILITVNIDNLAWKGALWRSRLASLGCWRAHTTLGLACCSIIA